MENPMDKWREPSNDDLPLPVENGTEDLQLTDSPGDVLPPSEGMVPFPADETTVSVEQPSRKHAFFLLEEDTPLTRPKGVRAFFFDNRFVLLAFLLPLAALSVVFAIYRVVPFGNNTILRIDLYHQYAPFFQELYRKLMGEGNLLYSFQTGLGTNFLGNFFNYLSSPFSLLILLFGEQNITEAIAAMVALKCAISSAAFCFYLKKSQKRQGYLAVGLSLAYAMCAYFTAYYWNVMWMDGLYLTPLVLLGLESLIREKKWKLYVFSLAMLMVCSYYIAFMVCLFTVFYFFAYYWGSKEQRLFKGFDHFAGSLLRYGLFSVLAVALAAVALLPMWQALSTSSATNGSFPSDWKLYFNGYEFVANLLPGVSPTIRSSAELITPNVYCGALAVFCYPLYLFSEKIPWREKLASLVLLLLLLASFSVNIFNYIWHAFHFPNDLPYRQSFLFCFLLLTMLYRVLVNFREWKVWQLLLCGGLCLAFVGSVAYFGQANTNIGTILFAAFAFAIYSWVACQLVSDRFSMRLLSLVLLVCLFVEVTMQNACYWQSDQPKQSYYAHLEEIEDILSDLEQEDPGFYRVEKDKSKTRNDPSLYGYRGVSTFSSLANEATSKTMRKLGMSGNNINSYTYETTTPFFNSIFSLKYIMSQKPLLDTSMYTELWRSDNYTVYENNYFLPVLFEMGQSGLNTPLNSPDVFQNQCNLLYTLTGNSDANRIFDRVSFESMTAEYAQLKQAPTQGGIFQYVPTETGEEQTPSFSTSIVPKETQHLFLFVTSSSVEQLTVMTAQGGRVTYDVKRPYIIDLGFCEQGESILLEFAATSSESAGSFRMHAYAANHQVYRSLYQSLQQGQVDITSATDSVLTAQIVSEKSGDYFVSIPYDELWKVYVDGNEVETKAVANAFLSFHVEKGSHQVSLVYHQRGLELGTMISGGTLAFLLLLILLTNIIDRKKRQRVGDRPEKGDRL